MPLSGDKVETRVKTEGKLLRKSSDFIRSRSFVIFRVCASFLCLLSPRGSIREQAKVANRSSPSESGLFGNYWVKLAPIKSSPYTSSLSNSGGVAYTMYNRCVVARLQVCNYGRLAGCSRSVATALNLVNLISGDNPAEYCRLPVIVGANQRSSPIWNSSSLGLSKTLVIPCCVSSGPIARMITLFGPVP